MNMNKVVGGILVALPLSASVAFAGHHEEAEMKGAFYEYEQSSRRPPSGAPLIR